MHWPRAAFVVGSLLAIIGPYLAKMTSWHEIEAIQNVGGLIIVIGGWLVAMSTNGGALTVKPIEEATR